MPGYRAYIIGADGHFRTSVELDCPDDEVAKERAMQLVDGHDVELWQQARKVALFEHKHSNGGKNEQGGSETSA